MINNEQSLPTRTRRPISPEELQGMTQSEGAEQVATPAPEVPRTQERKAVSPEDLKELATIKSSAAEIDRVVAERRDQYLKEARKESDMSRSLAAANNFVRGLTQAVPGALKTLAILQEGFLGATPQSAMARIHGEAIGKQLEEIFPENQLYRDEFWAGMVAQGAGQMTGQVLASLATGPWGAGSVFATNTMLTATLGHQYYEEAKAHGADDDTAFQAMLLNMGGNAGLNALPMALMMRRVDKLTGGSIKQVVKAGFKGSVEEALTEGLQTYFSNVVAKNMYDSARNLMDGVYEGMAVGGLLGGVANVSVTAIINQGVKADNAQKALAVEETLNYFYETHADHLTEGMSREAISEFLGHVKPKKGSKKVAATTTTTNSAIAEPRGMGEARDLDSRSNWKKFRDKFLSWAPLNERQIGLEMEHAKSWRDSQARRTELNIMRFNQGVLDHYGSKAKTLPEAVQEGSVPAEVIPLIDQAMRNPELVQHIPEGIREPLTSLREHVDQLTQSMIDMGMVQGDIAAHYSANLGVYLHRSYKLFDPNVEWNMSTIPPDVIDRAIVGFRNAINNELKQEGKTMTESQIKAEVEQRLFSVLRQKGEGSMQSLFKVEEGKPTIDRGERDVMRRRKDPPKFIRELMGEYKDPVMNYASTIEKMAGTISRRAMWDNIFDQFQGDLFLTEEQVMGLKDNHKYVQIKSDVDSKIDGAYVHPDLAEALTYVKDPNNNGLFMTGVYRFNSVAKYSKTVLSYVTVARNITGGMGFMLFNGHLFKPSNYKHAKTAFDLAFRSLKSLDKRGQAEKSLEYTDLNLYGKSVRAGEFLDTLWDAKLMEKSPNDAHLRFFERMAAGGKKNPIKTLANIAADFYRAGDDFVRIWFYELEKARYQAADPSITNQDVADITNDIYQNYERVNDFADFFRKVPIMSPFISFPSEVVRTVGNSAMLVANDLRSDNAAIRKIGYERLTGMATVATGSIALGISSMIANSISSEDDQAYREFMPPWDRNSIVAYTHVGDGVLRYINTSYTNPYAYLIDPMFALANGADDQTAMEVFMGSMKTLFEPLFSEEIFTQVISEVTLNAKRGGGEVYNPQDKIGDKMQKSFIHMWRAFEPGTLTSFKRAYQSLSGSYETVSKPEDEILGLLGLRIISIDVKDSFGFSVREQRSAIRDARRIYNSVKFREDADPYEIREAYERSNEQYEIIHNRMKVIYDSALRSGLTPRELQEVMKDSGLSQRDIDAIRHGVFRPFDR